VDGYFEPVKMSVTRILYVDDSDLHMDGRMQNLRSAIREGNMDIKIDDCRGYAEALIALKAAKNKGQKYDAVICDSILSGAFGSRKPSDLMKIADGAGAQELALSIRSGRVVSKIERHADQDIRIHYNRHAEESGLAFKDSDIVFAYCVMNDDFEKIQSRPSLKQSIDFYMTCSYIDNRSSRNELQEMLAEIVDKVKSKEKGKA
jgi:hypothetical protein